MDHEFERYENNNNRVTLYFKDRPDPVRAKLLVGCDGPSSAVRQECLKDDPPRFGVSLYRIFVPALGPMPSFSFKSATLIFMLDVGLKPDGSSRVDVVL
jgi:2-polyprenyl-6-methoxyphenol hydroxylase-like FAD-dependent oxidoreductase